VFSDAKIILVSDFVYIVLLFSFIAPKSSLFSQNVVKAPGIQKHFPLQVTHIKRLDAECVVSLQLKKIQF
jgi:hypothetical protein